MEARTDHTEAVRRIKKEFEAAYSARNAWAVNALEDDYFRNSVQWTKEQIATLESLGQFPMSQNKIYPAVEQGKGLLTANDPSFTAVGGEGSDRALASVYADIMSHIWRISAGKGELKQTVDDYYVRGLGYMMAWADPMADGGAGEIFVGNVDSLLVYVDKSTRDRLFRDAGYIVIMNQLTEQQILTTMPQYADVLSKARHETRNLYPTTLLVERSGLKIGIDNLPGDEKYYNVMNHYRRVLERVYDVRTGDGVTRRYKQDEYDEWRTQAMLVISLPSGPVVLDPEKDMAVLQELLAAGEADPLAIRNTTNGELVQAGMIQSAMKIVPHILRTFVIGDELAYLGTLKLDRYPIVPFCNRFHRNPYPSSDVRATRPIQQYINKLHSLIQAHTSNVVNQKVFIPLGSGLKKQIEEEWARVGTAVFEYNSSLGNPFFPQNQPLSSELFVHLERAEKSIEHIFGLYSFGQGDVQSAPETFRGTLAMEEFGQRRVRSKKDDIEESLSWLGGVVSQLIRDTYRAEKTIRLIQPNMPEREVKLNVPVYDQVSNDVIQRVNDVTSGQYDLVCVGGSTLPVNRWARFEGYKELYQMGVIDDVELLKQTEVVDVAGVLERKSLYSQMQQHVASLEAQLKEVMGDLQTARRESVQDEKRVELMKFKGELDEMKSALHLASRDFQRKLQVSAEEDARERAARRRQAKKVQAESSE